MARAHGYAIPPNLHTARGEVRKCGIEIEFAGLDVADAAKLVHELYGGRIEREDRFNTKVKDTSLGDFKVELDASFLKKQKHIGLMEKLGLSKRKDAIEGALESLAQTFIPNEIATPPTPIDRLHELDALEDGMRNARAIGTRGSILYAFGLHLNPEVPDLEARTLHRYLASFAILNDWIVEASKIDLTRKIAPFIDPFPDEYRALIIDPAYDPDRERLIADYLDWNPTRNRPLDMLPVFAELDEGRIVNLVREADQVKKRPALHYRLPNCEIDDPKWSFAVEWNRWNEVEKLAADELRFAAMRRAYTDMVGARIPSKRWVQEVERWIDRAA